MKTKEIAREQAQKILTHYMKKSIKCREQAEKIHNKEYTKNVGLRLSRMNQFFALKEQAENLENRGQKVWGMFMNNPKYWY